MGSAGGASKRSRTATRPYGRPSRGYYRYGGFWGKYKSRNLRRGIRPELKFKDTSCTFGAGTPVIPVTGVATGDIPCLNLLTTGSGPDQIVGRRIVIRQITISGTVTLPKSTNATWNNVKDSEVIRLMLCVDTQANGAQATMADLMDTTKGANGLRNMEKTARIKVLKEWRFKLDQEGSYTEAGAVYFSGALQVPFRYTKKCYYPVTYDNASASSITDIQDVNIFLGAISNSAAGKIECQTRIRFSDV